MPATSVPATSVPATSVPATSVPATSVPASACPTSLSGAYQTPHLIVPISSSSPDTAYGTQYGVTINATTSTIFNFDIPSSYSGQQCSLIFVLPEQSQLATSSYTYEAADGGAISFGQLSGAASASTSYSNAPNVANTLNTIAVAPGNSYVVASAACAAGTTESFALISNGALDLSYFQDYNPCAIGLYITASG